MSKWDGENKSGGLQQVATWLLLRRSLCFHSRSIPLCVCIPLPPNYCFYQVASRPGGRLPSESSHQNILSFPLFPSYIYVYMWCIFFCCSLAYPHSHFQPHYSVTTIMTIWTTHCGVRKNPILNPPIFKGPYFSPPRYSSVYILTPSFSPSSAFFRFFSFFFHSRI